MNKPHPARLLVFSVCMMALTAIAVAQAPHTPKAGSAERQAICDGMRDFVKGTALKPLPKPVVFKISNLRVLGDYCFIECLPMFKDGSDAVPEFLPDVGYMHCLKKERGAWKVVLDLSRTDVPSDGEVREIRRSLPPDFPLAVLSDFWRDLFAKTK